MKTQVRLIILLSIICLSLNARAADTRYYDASSSCVFNTPAFETGEKIAYGDPIARQFDSVLYGHEFNYDDDVIEPFQLAYAFYIMADRVGDLRGKNRMAWAENYLHNDARDRIKSAIFRKYSLAYLRKCFVGGEVNPNGAGNHNSPTGAGEDVNDTNFHLYMYRY